MCQWKRSWQKSALLIFWLSSFGVVTRQSVSTWHNSPWGPAPPPLETWTSSHLPGGLVETEKQMIGLGRAGGLLSLILPRDQQKNRTIWLLGHLYDHWEKSPLGEVWKIYISLLNILGDSEHREEGEFYIGSLSFLIGSLSLSEWLLSLHRLGRKTRQRASPYVNLLLSSHNK